MNLMLIYCQPIDDKQEFICVRDYMLIWLFLLNLEQVQLLLVLYGSILVEFLLLDRFSWNA
uniref:Uncharacterized protein n=1 Tax=Globisporangium ultimum (strain ATCC 200006 / CBS 805.95 / DAOM BR144) TaxID=431595 RepID=K3XCJ5_GLOUD